MIELKDKKVYVLLDKMGHPSNWTSSLCVVEDICIETSWIKLRRVDKTETGKKKGIWYALSRFDEIEETER